MKNKCLALLIGILISGCNSNGTASKVSPRLPQVIKSIASSVNKTKVGAVLGTYVCTFHDRKTKLFGGQIPTLITVPGEFKKIQNIPFTGGALDVSFFMPSEAPDYNKIMSQCEARTLAPDDDIIDGVKVSTDLKSSFLYDIYNPNLIVNGKDKFLEELNKRSNLILLKSIINGAQYMWKPTCKFYKDYNFDELNIPVNILDNGSKMGLLHSGRISDRSFKSEVFNVNRLPETIGEIKKEIDSTLFYIDSDAGFASVQHPNEYHRYALKSAEYEMVANFIASYDSKYGFELLNNSLTESATGSRKLYWRAFEMSYRILYDENNKNLIHVYVTDTVKPMFKDSFNNVLRTLEIAQAYQITIDYTLDSSKYKKSTMLDTYGNNSVSISKVTPIKDFRTPSASLDKTSKFEASEDFMRQMVFNSYQNQGGKGRIDEKNNTHIRNYDVWEIK